MTGKYSIISFSNSTTTRSIVEGKYATPISQNGAKRKSKTVFSHNSNQKTELFLAI